MIVFGPLGTGPSVALVVATKVASIYQVQSSSLCVNKNRILSHDFVLGLRAAFSLLVLRNFATALLLVCVCVRVVCECVCGWDGPQLQG